MVRLQDRQRPHRGHQQPRSGCKGQGAGLSLTAQSHGDHLSDRWQNRPQVGHLRQRSPFKRATPGTLRYLMADKKGSFGRKGEIDIINRDAGNQATVATILKTALNDYQGRILEHTESFHHAGVHIHSKIIAADPFGLDPILITGSANFSKNSTTMNDENGLVIRGNSAIMDIYATEFMRMFEHYWFRYRRQEWETKAKSKGKTKTKATETMLKLD